MVLGEAKERKVPGLACLQRLSTTGEPLTHRWGYYDGDERILVCFSFWITAHSIHARLTFACRTLEQDVRDMLHKTVEGSIAQTPADARNGLLLIRILQELCKESVTQKLACHRCRKLLHCGLWMCEDDDSCGIMTVGIRKNGGHGSVSQADHSELCRMMARIPGFQ